jgi:hypothetical protein
MDRLEPMDVAFLIQYRIEGRLTFEPGGKTVRPLSAIAFISF